MKTWLVVDVNNLAWRAFHVFKGLSIGGKSTGVVFGILKDIRVLMDQHATRRIVFCFDHGQSKRKELYPNYKLARHSKELTVEQEADFKQFRIQLNKLRTDYLPRLGFKNVFYQKGYEADDIIAQVVKNLKRNEEAIIVSSDKDLYQLLSPKCLIWNPGKKECITHESFQEEWKITPTKWATVKAIAGCSTDGVRGIKGLGDITAAAYLRGDHPPESRIDKLVQANKGTVRDNLKLVKLPLAGCKTPALIEDRVSEIAWRNLTRQLGMKSLLRSVPNTPNGFGMKPRKLKSDE